MTRENQGHRHLHFSTVGGVVGGLVGLIVIILLLFFFRRRANALAQARHEKRALDLLNADDDG